MIVELTAAVKCMTAIKDLAKTLQTGSSDVKWREHVAALIDNIIDLQSRMLAIQAEYQNIAELNQQLKHQIENYKQWDSTASRYKLNELVTGMFVYAIKPECQSDEPSHWLCPNCFQKQQPSILTRTFIDYPNYKCHNCTLEIRPEP